MYKDIISYELADSITEERLLTVAQDIIDSWMKKLSGFVSWEINKTSDDKYIDIVTWQNQENAKNAEVEMMNIPNAMDWFACYKEGSISSVGVFSVKQF